MSKLKIHRDDLIQALTFRFELIEGVWYLDTETGEVLLDADAAEAMPEDIQENPRYQWIEPISSHESFRIMERFVASLSDANAAPASTARWTAASRYDGSRCAAGFPGVTRGPFQISGGRAHLNGRSLVRRKRY